MATQPKNIPADATAPVVSLKAIEPIRIDGVDVAPGEYFDAAPVDAEALKSAGAAADFVTA